MTEAWAGRRAAWLCLPALLKERIITGALPSNASNDHVSFDCAQGMINKLEELSHSLKWPMGKKKKKKKGLHVSGLHFALR